MAEIEAEILSAPRARFVSVVNGRECSEHNSYNRSFPRERKRKVSSGIPRVTSKVITFEEYSSLLIERQRASKLFQVPLLPSLPDSIHHSTRSIGIDGKEVTMHPTRVKP